MKANMQCQGRAQVSQVLNLERVREFELWLKTTETKLTQVNGQRKYGGPPEVWDGPIPGSHCEVFISQIPRDTYEDLLIPLFSSVGPLWEFRLMMNFSGQNRGFAYAKYGSAAVAASAIQLLHGHMLEPRSRLSVRRSTEKRHLCMEYLPTNTKQEELLKVLRVLTEGVETVSLKSRAGIDGVSAIIAFSSHHNAAMAKRVLAEAFKKQFSLSVSIEWLTGGKQRADEPLHLKAPSKSLLPTHLDPQHEVLNIHRSSLLPPQLARPSSIPPGFCRAVGGPAVMQHPPPPSSAASSYAASKGHLAGTHVMLLHKLCEATGVGKPNFEILYSHADPDGYLNFTYKVCIPGVSSAIKGQIAILPRPSSLEMQQEAQQAVALQVLQRVCNIQPPY